MPEASKRERVLGWVGIVALIAAFVFAWREPSTNHGVALGSSLGAPIGALVGWLIRRFASRKAPPPGVFSFAGYVAAFLWMASRVGHNDWLSVLNTYPVAVEVSIDGKVVGPIDAGKERRWPLAPGEHTIAVSPSGGAKEEASLTATRTGMFGSVRAVCIMGPEPFDLGLVEFTYSTTGYGASARVTPLAGASTRCAQVPYDRHVPLDSEAVNPAVPKTLQSKGVQDDRRYLCTSRKSGCLEATKQ